MKETRDYQYKDANRYWWTIKVTELDSVEIDNIDSTQCHKRWNVEIRRDDVFMSEYEIVGQYDIAPTITAAFLPFMLEMNAVAMGIAKYC